jgi:hypothetical protein
MDVSGNRMTRNLGHKQRQSYRSMCGMRGGICHSGSISQGCPAQRHGLVKGVGSWEGVRTRRYRGLRMILVENVTCLKAWILRLGIR